MRRFFPGNSLLDMQQQPISGDIGSLMAKGPPETHIEPSNTFHDATAHDLDISLKGTIVPGVRSSLSLGVTEQQASY